MTIAFGHGLSVTPLQLAAATLASRQWRLCRAADLPAALARGGHERQSPRVLKAETSAGDAEADAAQRVEGHRQARQCRRLSRRRQDRHGGEGGAAPLFGVMRSSRASFRHFPPMHPEYLVLVMLDEPQRVAGDPATRRRPAPMPRRPPARSSSGSAQSSAWRRGARTISASLTPRCSPPIRETPVPVGTCLALEFRKETAVAFAGAADVGNDSG